MVAGERENKEGRKDTIQTVKRKTSKSMNIPSFSYAYIFRYKKNMMSAISKKAFQSETLS